jgi:predicted transcriptional regulator
MSSKLLTEQEYKVMDVLWKIRKGFVKDVLAHWPHEPLPAYNTVSTIIRILEEKGFVDHESHGRSHQYFPKIGRSRYQKRALGKMIDQVFDGKMGALFTALADHEQLSKEQISEIKDIIEKAPDSDVS